MSFPHFPDPARRAKILQAHQLRQQGLTLRQIAEIMGCAHSTVAGYLRDFEHFRADLLHELAADQIVCHVIQLADIADEHHDKRLAAVRELRLLLGAVPDIRRDEHDRARELTQNGLSVDRYGQRHLMLNRQYFPTPEELDQLEQAAHTPIETDFDLDPDQPLACPPVPDSLDSPVPDLIGDPLGSPQDITTDQTRTEPNKAEQESSENPAQDAESSIPERKSLQRAIDNVDRQLEEALRYRDWINDYPPHNPGHTARVEALALVEKRDALLAQLQQLTAETEAPDAA